MADVVEEFPPPERLSKRAREAWREVVALHGSRAGRIVGPALEVFCEAVGRAREAYERVAAEGMIAADPRGVPIPHPALAIAKQAEATIEKLGVQFAPRVSRSRDGFMVRRTRESVRAAGLDKDETYSGAVGAALTLALVIDNAQEEGSESLRRSAYGPIPTYLKAIRDLGLMPVVSAVEAGEDVSEPGVGPVSLDQWRAAQGGA